MGEGLIGGCTVRTVTDLRAGYAAPLERAVRKSLPALDRHMRDFIALSPSWCWERRAVRGRT
jgi:hypothetical protein